MNSQSNESGAHAERENARLRGDLLTLAKRFSHDLRTPLGGIVTAAEAIREVLAEFDPSAVPLADSLLTSAEEMTQLIKQVSFLARATACPLPKTTVHMADAVFSAIQRSEGQIMKRNARVMEPPSWPRVSGVLTWLEMIWWQLLVNVLKRRQEPCGIELGWDAQKDSLRFWICDTGSGLAPAPCGKLFKEFSTLHDDQDLPGIELSIVQRLVELQGGLCGYERSKQGGAYFFFTLPDTPESMKAL